MAARAALWRRPRARSRRRKRRARRARARARARSCTPPGRGGAARRAWRSASRRRARRGRPRRPHQARSFVAARLELRRRRGTVLALPAPPAPALRGEARRARAARERLDRRLLRDVVPAAARARADGRSQAPLALLVVRAAARAARAAAAARAEPVRRLLDLARVALRLGFGERGDARDPSQTSGVRRARSPRPP